MLKDVGHKLSNTRAEYIEFKGDIFKECILENNVVDLCGGAQDVPGVSRGHYLVDGELMP